MEFDQIWYVFIIHSYVLCIQDPLKSVLLLDFLFKLQLQYVLALYDFIFFTNKELLCKSQLIWYNKEWE